jgi:hypothetical protein
MKVLTEKHAEYAKGNGHLPSRIRRIPRLDGLMENLQAKSQHSEIAVGMVQPEKLNESNRRQRWERRRNKS